MRSEGGRPCIMLCPSPIPLSIPVRLLVLLEQASYVPPDPVPDEQRLEDDRYGEQSPGVRHQARQTNDECKGERTNRQRAKNRSLAAHRTPPRPAPTGA